MSIVLRTLRERNIGCSIWVHLPAAINPSTHRALHKKSGKPGGTLTWGQRIFKGFSIIVVAEITCLGVAYIQWSMMNRDQNYRYKMTRSSVGSLMLEGYYSFGEKMDPSNKIREHDTETWRMQGRVV